MTYGQEKVLNEIPGANLIQPSLYNSILYHINLI